MIGTQTYSHHQWNQIAAVWDALVAAARPSFFLTREWVETWIEVFGPSLNPRIIVFDRGGNPIGACLLVERTHWRRFLPMRRVHLNCAGENEADSACIEYNRLLCLPGEEGTVTNALWHHLGQQAWDELRLAGMESPLAAADAETRRRPCWYVDLAALRRSGETYETYLSSNSRQQVRRALRYYEPASLTIASDLPTARQYFDELAALHQKSWPDRGKPGVFASPLFVDFHRRLIERTFPLGRVHLLRATAGDRAIGLLYCFCYQGRVYFYQSGFDYESDNRAKPGLVTHYLAINHYLQSCPNVAEYDFLAGDSQYKRSLGKSERTLEWSVIQRPTIRVKAWRALRRLAKHQA